jgi:hypothetical protein
MASVPPRPAVFGPFDGDFDPFEDDEDLGMLVEFERTRRTGMLPPGVRRPGAHPWHPIGR